MCSLLCFVYYIVDVELAPNHLRYVYIYIYTHLFIFIYIYVHMHTYMYWWMHLSMHYRFHTQWPV